jgi:NAD(P)-dependent dehydrogenase (short-subunit alcohol dehydrogenase family)
MSTPTIANATRREPALLGQTVVVIGGSLGIGLETGRLARAEGAKLILTGRNPERLENAAREVGAMSSAAFDATDFDRLKKFFDELSSPIDHVLVTGPGPYFDATDFDRLKKFFDELSSPIDHVLVTGPGPYYAPLAEFDVAQARRYVDAHLLLPLEVARNAASKVRPGGTLLFIGGTGGRRTAVGLALISALTAAKPAMVKNLALELAPVRVNLIAPGFVDTPLSAAILGDQLDARRERLRTTLPIRRVVGPADIAALAVHLMTNTAITGATYDIDGGQQLIEG